MERYAQARKKRIILPEGERKAMILDSALRVFSRHGFETTDVDWIATDARIGKGTIYRHFPSKQKLFLAVVDRGYAQLKEQMEELARLNAAMEAKIKRGLTIYVEFFTRNPRYYRVMVIEQPGVRLGLGAEILRGYERFNVYLTQAIQSAIEEREFRKIDAVFAAKSLRAIAAVIIDRYLQRQTDSYKADIATAMEIFLKGIKK